MNINNMHQHHHGHHHHDDKPLAKRLKEKMEGRHNKYAQEPELVVDLHGYTTMGCRDILNELIESRAYSHIRVIVGKGLNSENGAVLPDFVRNYLTSNGISFNQSKIQDGGEGALEVFLN